ncbi:DEBR0S5_12354g1_1 [Brettanomyces bruxellensis]|uniref:DEBR0S5_12354g1_1 n=1 Tax=Dekkera bruxellensis TaxID=5007 RepID=A0A7D9H279_DEKBR|nr:DEBR0S5_12354g1_1 [Brettanomyces bruxellensis]
MTSLQIPERFITNQSRATSFRYDKKNIYINEVPIPKDDFVYAFGGSLTSAKRVATPQEKQYADPVPTGLASFSCTVFPLGLILMHAGGVTVSNVLIGAFLTTSGLVDLIVGIMCFIVGKYMGLLYFPSLVVLVLICFSINGCLGGVSASYPTTGEYDKSIALFFLPWLYSPSVFGLAPGNLHGLFFVDVRCLDLLSSATCHWPVYWICQNFQGWRILLYGWCSRIVQRSQFEAVNVWFSRRVKLLLYQQPWLPHAADQTPTRSKISKRTINSSIPTILVWMSIL